jgi:hypothetical protein
MIVLVPLATMALDGDSPPGESALQQPMRSRRPALQIAGWSSSLPSDHPRYLGDQSRVTGEQEVGLTDSWREAHVVTDLKRTHWSEAFASHIGQKPASGKRRETSHDVTSGPRQ